MRLAFGGRGTHQKPFVVSAICRVVPRLAGLDERSDGRRGHQIRKGPTLHCTQPTLRKQWESVTGATCLASHKLSRLQQTR